MPGAGDLRDRLRFERRQKVADGAGNFQADWRKEFDRAANIKPLVGGETVIADRLQGVQPAVLTVRYDASTIRVTPDWRAVDCRTGEIYQIKSVVDQDRKRAWLTMMAQAGVAG